MEENHTTLTDDQINSIAGTLSSNASDEVKNIRKIYASDAITPEEGLEMESITTSDANSSMEEQMVDRYPEADIDILSCSEEAVNTINTEKRKEYIKEGAKYFLPDKELSDEDAENFCQVILKYKSGEKFNVYKEMPPSIQSTIRKLAMENGIPASNLNYATKAFLESFTSSVEFDEVFVDFEKSIKEALNIPNVVDMYSEQINETMTIKMTDMADKLDQDGYLDKAKMLRDISNTFIDARDLVSMKETFDNNSKARKAVRRDADRVKRYCDEFNFKNEKSKFKMSDVTTMIDALKKVLIDDPTAAGEEIGSASFVNTCINKFMILWCKTCENKNPNDIIDAAYMYYGMKNIAVLMYTNENKTEFSKTLIQKVKDLMMYIQEKEIEFSKAKEN